MDASIVSVVDSDAVPDPSAVIGEMAPRRVRRLLDSYTRGPFVTAVRTIGSLESVDLEKVAFYTVSWWDPGVPVPDAATADDEELVDYYLHPSNASDWLRRMPHAMACQVAVATGVRGPNLHLVGGPDSLRILLHLATHALRRHQVDAAVILAFDDPAKSPHVLPDDGVAQAMGLALRSGDGMCAASDLMTALDQASASGSVAPTALETVRDLMSRLVPDSDVGRVRTLRA